jgi:hypothetical protein
LPAPAIIPTNARVRRGGEAALKDINLLAVDYDQIEKDASTIKKKFNEVFQ